MSLLWIGFTLMAAFMQSWRNALQKQLRQHASTLGVTLARFIMALPLAGLYLYGLYGYYLQTPLPVVTPSFVVYIVIAGISQIMATALMVMLFKSRNYAIGVGLAKSEAVIAATLGALFFHAPLPPLAWLGVLVGAIAVWLMSLTRQPSQQKSGLSFTTIATGLGSGLCFALCTLYIREATLLLRMTENSSQHQMGFLISAAWVLFLVIMLQTVLLTLWLAWREPATLKTLLHHKKLTTSVSLFSFLGSIGWFTAMSLQTVAMVKTLGQIEVVFTLAISAFWFKEQLQASDYWGLILIVIGALLVVLA